MQQDIKKRAKKEGGYWGKYVKSLCGRTVKETSENLKIKSKQDLDKLFLIE